MTPPYVSGYCTMAPANSPESTSTSFASPTTTVTPSGAMRVSTRSMVCGWQRSETKTLGRFLTEPRHICMASAAAVASSSSDALQTCMPVRSQTMVWKLSSICSRPWLISAW